jgi:hypothetical protein
MSSVDRAGPSHRLFRGAALLFAFVLAGQAVWILAAEFNRPAVAEFPADARDAAAATAQRQAATLAASVGAIRGDLWAESALTYLGLFWNDDQGKASPQMPGMIAQARAVAIRALTLSPHDARIWLVLASIDSQPDSPNRKPADALRMSYYTGANEPELIALRLPLAVQSDALADDDFRQLVSHDIRIIVTRRQELKPVIRTAYREASPSGRRFIEQVLQELDPSLLATLQQQ